MKLLLVSVLLVAAVEAASLGKDHCTWGPSYWCGSLQKARSCQAFSHCLKTVWKPQGPHPVHLTKECLYSQKLVKTIGRDLTVDKVDGEAKYLIGSMCSFVSEEPLRKECKDLVTNFMPEIFELMESGMEPWAVAGVLGLCRPQKDQASGMEEKGTHRVVSMDQTRGQVSRVPHRPLGQQDPVKPLPKGDNKSMKGKPAEQKVEGSAECDACKVVMTVLDDLLKENKTEAAIEEALDKVCQRLPANISVECKSFVDEYAPVVIQLLVQELDPQKVCQSLGLCNSSAEHAMPTQRSGSLCPLCEVVVGILEERIESNKTEKAIEEALDEVCKVFRSTTASECESVINTYAPAIIDLLLQELQPQEICEKIRLCNSSSLKVPEAVPKVEEKSAGFVECELCKALISEINSLLGDRTEQGIVVAVEKVCDVVSGDLRLQCRSEVENYGSAVLDLLKHMDDPTQVCTFLQQCTAARSANTSPHGKQMMLGSEECTYGPSFWCANMENARKCGMEQECVLKYGLKP